MWKSSVGVGDGEEKQLFVGRIAVAVDDDGRGTAAAAVILLPVVVVVAVAVLRGCRWSADCGRCWIEWPRC